MPESPCIGRAAELNRLGVLVREAAAGRGTAVLVEGEPGIGKTVLLSALIAECTRQRMRVRHGRAEALERRLPFATLHACLGTGAGDGDEEDAVPLPDVRAFDHGTVAADCEFAVAEATLDLIDRWCARGPVALVIDDVQWIDPSTAAVLDRLGRDLAQQPLLLVLATSSTGRDEASAGLLHGLAARGARTLSLEPLDEPAVARLVADMLGAPAGSALLRLVTRAGGNPMYVGELLAALARDGAIRMVGGVADIAGGTGWHVPRSLVEAIQQRLGFLPRQVRRTLGMVAVLGQTIDVTELSLVLDTPVTALSEVVDEGMAAGLLADDRGTLTFRHELIRESLAEHLPSSVRAALHLRAGRILAASGAPVERVAGHLLSGSLLDRSTLAWLLDAADALTARAPDLAVPLLRRALGTVDGEPAQPLRFHLVRALMRAGRVEEAEQAAQAALVADRAHTRDGALRWLLAQARYRQGRVGEVVAMIEDSLASPHLDPAEAGRFHGVLAVCFLILEQLDAARAAAETAVSAGEATGDPVAVGYGCHVLAGCLSLQGELRAALAFSDRAITRLSTGEPPALDIDPYAVRAACLIGLDRLAEADDALAEGVRHSQRGAGVHLATDHSLRARVRFLDGRWDDALAEIRTGLEIPDPYHFGAGLTALKGLVAVHRGGPPPGPAGPDEPDTSVGGRAYAYLAVWAQALVEEARGNSPTALRMLCHLWDRPTGLSPRRLCFEICPDLARLAVATGDRDRLLDLVRTTEELAAREPCASLTGTALLCRGLADDDADLLLAAAADFQQARRLLAEGYAYEAAAEVLARRGSPGAAREALDSALTVYSGLDAAWDVARATARLRQAGIGRGNRRIGKRPRYGWAALTDTETKIALLVAEGLSNPDIARQMYLSRRTVQTHVSHVLAKLGLKSRVELAVEAVRHPAE